MKSLKNKYLYISPIQHNPYDGICSDLIIYDVYGVLVVDRLFPQITLQIKNSIRSYLEGIILLTKNHPTVTMGTML